MSKDIDDPGFRYDLAMETGIKLAEPIPESLFNSPVVAVGNYLSRNENPSSPDLTPTLNGLLALAYEMSIHEKKNRVWAIAREGVFDFVEQQSLFFALQPAIIFVKWKDRKYKLGLKDGLRTRRHLGLKRKGVLWMAPGYTTRSDGLVLNVRTGSVLLARKSGSKLVVLAMETKGEGDERMVNQIHVAEIPIPGIICDIKGGEAIRLQRAANRAITRYALAFTASLLPEHNNKGEYEDPDEFMQEARYQLLGIRHDGLIASGGFLNE